MEKGNLGSPLLIYNRNTQRAFDLRSKLGEDKTEVVESISDGVAKANVIITCLSNDAVVQEFMDVMLQGKVDGKSFVESSTLHPKTTEALAEKVIAAGAEFVAAPVFGTPAVAENGQLIAVLGGPKASVDKARPYYSGVMARAEIDLSDKPYGQASTMKLVGNTVFSMVEQLAEAHTFAEKLGLGTDAVHQFVELFCGGTWAKYSNRILTGDRYKAEQPLVGVDLVMKDANHVFKMAKDVGVKLGLAEVAYKHLEDFKEHQGSEGGELGEYMVRLERSRV